MTNSKRSPGLRDRDLGQRLRALRELRGQSQSDLAKTVGITFQQIQKYEYGINRISAIRLVELCAALDTDVSELLDCQPKNPS